MLHRHRPRRGAFDLPIGIAIVAATAAMVLGCGGAAGAGAAEPSDMFPLGAAGAGGGPSLPSSLPASSDLAPVEQTTSSPLAAGTQ